MAETKYRGGGLSLKVYKDQEWSKVETTSSSEGGGGGSTPDAPSGGGDWHYFDVSALDLTDATTGAYINSMLMMVRFEMLGQVCIASAGYYAFAKVFAGGDLKILAFGLDFTQSMIQGGAGQLYKELIDEAKNNGLSLTEITEEEFYSLE